MVKVGQAVSLPAAAWCARQLFWLRLSAHPVPQLFVVALNACSPALAKPQARKGIAPEFLSGSHKAPLRPLRAVQTGNPSS